MTHTQPQNEFFSVRSLLSGLFKRKKVILGVFSAAMVFALLLILITEPVYEAGAKILVERELDAEKALLLQMKTPIKSDSYDWVKSEIEIIKSYPVSRHVIEEMGLLTIFPSIPAELATDPTTHKKYTKELQRSMTVGNGKKSNVIHITYEANQPDLAASVVDQVIASYLRYRSEIYDESESYRFFHEQMEIANSKLQDLEKRQRDFKYDAQIISPETQAAILTSKLMDYERSLTAVHTSRISREARLEVLKAHVANGAELLIPSTQASENPNRERYITKLKSELLEAEIQRDRLLQDFKPTYIEAVKLDHSIATLKAKVAAEVTQVLEQEAATIMALRAEERAHEKSLAELRSQIRNLAHKEYEFSQLSRGIDDNREVYSMLLRQREEARLSLARLDQDVKIRVINPAIAPIKASSPGKVFILAVAVVLGLMGGLGSALVLEYFDHTINSGEDLEYYAGLPVLGSIPELKFTGHRMEAR